MENRQTYRTLQNLCLVHRLSFATNSLVSRTILIRFFDFSIAAILDGYDKFHESGQKLSSLLYEIQGDHLDQFSMTWVLLNKRIYQRFVFAEFQDLIPDCIYMLKSRVSMGTYTEIAHRLVHLDEDMNSIKQSWVNVWERLQMFHFDFKDKVRGLLVRQLKRTLDVISLEKLDYEKLSNCVDDIPITQWSRKEDREMAWLWTMKYLNKDWKVCDDAMVPGGLDKMCNVCKSASARHLM